MRERRGEGTRYTTSYLSCQVVELVAGKLAVCECMCCDVRHRFFLHDVLATLVLLLGIAENGAVIF